jgi:hypothetical protein
MKALFTLIFVFGFFLSVTAQVVPALQADQAILDIINSLGDNEGAFLPDFTVTDMYGGAGLAAFSSFATRGPGIRDYCNKWPYSPNRKRALYAGGNHGSPHRFNDVWEYDLAANTWVMIHKPDAGVEPCHTWWGLTYDRKGDQLYWMNSAGWVWSMDGYGGPPFRNYDPYAQNGWDIVRASQPYPGPSTMQGGSLEYIPGRDITIWYGCQWNGSGMWFYNRTTHKWTQLLGRYDVYGEANAPQAEAVMNYDRTHDVLVSALRGDIFTYSFKTNTWQKKTSGSFYASDSRSAFTYDPCNAIHLHYSQGALMAYDYGSNSITNLTPKGDAMFSNTAMCYYDEQHKVFVFYNEGSKHYVYRYKKTSDCTVKSEPRFRDLISSSKQVRVTLYDIHGKVISRLSNGSIPSHLPSGVYFLGYKAGAKRFVKKIMINR